MTLLVAMLAAASLSCSACAPHAVLVEAHRGGAGGPSGHLPENTLPAFRAGEEAGADVIEMDAHLLADGTLAILHDDTLDRTTDATGCIGARVRTDLAGIDAGARTALAGQGIHVSTLDETLVAVRSPIDLELKRESDPRCPPPSPEALARAMVTAVDHAQARRRVRVSSFDREVLASIHALAPDVSLALLSVGPVSPDDARALGVRAVALSEASIDGAVVAALHARALEVSAWTVDAPESALRLTSLGVDRVITDEPAAILRALGSRSRGPRGLLRALVACGAVAAYALLSRRRRMARGPA